jgi:hypothetical protein
MEEHMSGTGFSRLSELAFPGLLLACAIASLAIAISASSAALANDKYFNTTRKDCSACHVNVSADYKRLTRYGTAFLNNGCPQVRGGC